MTVEIAIVLGLLVAGMVLFATEALPADVTALSLLSALVATGVLTPAEAFAGFGSEIIILLAAVMVLAGAVVKSGVLDGLGRLAHRVGGGRPRGALLSLLMLSAGSSSLFSNTTTTAVLMPAAIETARRAAISPSRVLMPLAFASMLGGAGTLIGTSANLAGSAMAERLGLQPFGLFEFLGVGAAVALSGLLWLALPGFALLPARRPVAAGDGAEPRGFFTTLGLAEGSAMIGRTVAEAGFDAFEADLLAVERDGERLAPHPARKLREGDRLIVRATRDGILKLRRSPDVVLEPDLDGARAPRDEAEPVLAEAVIAPQSRLAGQTLRRTGVFDRHRAVVLAIWRRDRSRPARIENLRLRAGDLMLLEAPEDEVVRLGASPDLRVLSRVDAAVVTRREGGAALAAMAAALLLGAFGVVPLSLAFLVAVLVVVVAGNLDMAEAYRVIEWRLLVLIAAMSGFGLAMQDTGAAEYLAGYVVGLAAPFGPLAAMAGLSLLTVVLTQPMSNAAAALTVIPIAVAAADGLGLDPRMLAILVTLSASMSFLSPLEPACLLVYDAGRYRFLDYVRAGLPLTLICNGLLLLLVPLVWG
ncbi:SLC13 family permease [Roseicyclus persicicus]|uniref:SLC13 family permease n=1 Tax=Roseicyclus persicicus TaxID=2650661 RepID=A0A7X6H0G9_9RHOB|nr:SLC13 family permease [Roseibacterium persicicum]NKX45756.1 SLC13 family permease [Roseibacterium persicicum]